MPNMSGYSNLRHVVVTPSRDEADFLPSLIQSMVSQTITPLQWVIMVHNSEDESLEIISEAARKNNWISAMVVGDDTRRKRGSQIAKIVNTGFESIESDWDFISKIDADMVLPSDYFERIFFNFASSEKLGIASGSCYLIEAGRKVSEQVSSDHTRGGLKTYRRSCYEEIGGIREVDGWDGIDNAIAQMNGWKTCGFTDIEVLHQRRTGSYSGLVRGCFEAGKFAHSMRYFPPFILARSLHRMLRKPILIGGFSMLAGYFYNSISRSPTFRESDVVTFIRNKQKDRLKFWK